MQDDDEHEEEEDDLGVEVERLEKEVSDEDALSDESPADDAEDDGKLNSTLSHITESFNY